MIFRMGVPRPAGLDGRYRGLYGKQRRTVAVGCGSGRYQSFVHGSTTLRWTEWNGRIRLTFLLPRANYSRFYLVSDAQDLEGSLHGYYLQFGEAPPTMPWSSFVRMARPACRLSGARTAWLPTPSPSAFAYHAMRPVSEHLLDNCRRNRLPIRRARCGILVHIVRYTGWSCVYTSGNRDGFELDDVMILPLQVDSVAPRFVQLATESDRSLRLLFDETIEPGSAANTIHYRLDQERSCRSRHSAMRLTRKPSCWNSRMLFRPARRIRLPYRAWRMRRVIRFATRR